MFRQSVVSSNVRSVGHDSASNTLEVEFRNGSVYHYYGVPQQKYHALVNAHSVGTYLSAHIKGIYNYRRIV
ncbi:MAG TPA: KTSC domain-containing protein [bacterium]|nr:KTSC domain-containing protein [bacterium]